MAGFGIEVKVSDSASERLLKLAQAGKDPKPAFVAIVDYLELQTRRRFDAETAPDGTAWKANAPGTKKFSIKKVLHGETLMLRDMFEHTIGEDGFEFGSNRIYARIHQLGGKTGRKRKVMMPARPFLGISAADMEVIEEEIATHLNNSGI